MMIPKTGDQDQISGQTLEMNLEIKTNQIWYCDSTQICIIIVNIDKCTSYENRLIYWLTDWKIDWLKYWLTDWLPFTKHLYPTVLIIKIKLIL